MIDVNKIWSVLPAAAIAALAICWLLGSVEKKRGKKNNGIGVQTVRFLLTVWGILYLCLTLVLPMGNGMGEAVNLKPLRPFAVAARYGTVNAPMLQQFLLELAAFVPFGLMLPLVFRQCRRFWKVFLLTFGGAVVGELLQLAFIGCADVDDVLANILGGMLGYGFYVLGAGMWMLWKWRHGTKGSPSFFYKKQALRSIMVVLGILFLAASAVGLQYADARHIYGTFYYGHLKPRTVEAPEGISDTSFLSPIYLYEEEEEEEELMERLAKRTGFRGEFGKNGDTWVLKESERRRIIVSSWNRWSVYWDFGSEAAADPSLIPLEKDAIEAAKAVLQDLELPEQELKFVGTLKKNADGNLRLAFEKINREEAQGKKSWGQCVVTVGEHGYIQSVEYGIVNCRFVTREHTISPRKAIDVAGDVGVGYGNGTASVTDVQPSWYFHEDTGYLTPAWKIDGTMITEGGEQHLWQPLIDGIK